MTTTKDFSGTLSLEQDVVAAWTGEIARALMAEATPTAIGECRVYIEVDGVRGARLGSASVHLEPDVGTVGFRAARCSDRSGTKVTDRDWARTEGAILAAANRAVR